MGAVNSDGESEDVDAGNGMMCTSAENLIETHVTCSTARISSSAKSRFLCKAERTQSPTLSGSRLYIRELSVINL